MAYAFVLDATLPANTALLSQGAGNIRDFKSAMIERVNSFFVDINAQPWVGKNGASMGSTAFGGLITANAGLTVAAGTTTTQALVVNTTAQITGLLSGGSNISVSAPLAVSQAFFSYNLNATPIWAHGPNANHGGKAWDLYNYGTATSAIGVDVGTNIVTLYSGMVVPAGTTAVQVLTATTGDFSSNVLIEGNLRLSTSSFSGLVASGSIVLGNESPIYGTVADETTVRALLQLDGTNRIRLDGAGWGVVVGPMTPTNMNDSNIAISNAVAPTGNPTGGGFLWVDFTSHALKFRGAAGTITTLAAP